MARFGAKAAEGNFVAVFDESALLAIWQRQRLRTARREFQQTGPARWLRSGHRAGSDQIAGLKIAAIAGMVRNHLRKGPVHLRERTLRQSMRRLAIAAHGPGRDIGFERDVQAAPRPVLRVIE